MKKFLILILFVFSYCPAMVNAESNYTSWQNHYSFTVPVGWAEIPKSKIDEAMQQVSEVADAKFINYDAGFQYENEKFFQYPYVLVLQHKVNTPTYNQIAQSLNDEFSDKNTDEISNKYSEMMINATVQDPFIDKKRNIIFTSIETDIVNVGRVKGLVAMFLGKDGITQINFYSIKSEYLENLSTFNLIIDSFEYEQGYEYNEEEAKKNSPNIFDGAVEKGIIGGVIGAATVVYIFIFRIIFKLKEKREEKIKNETVK